MKLRAILLSGMIGLVFYTSLIANYLVSEGTKVFPKITIKYSEYFTFELLILLFWGLALLISLSLIPEWITVKNKINVNVDVGEIKEQVRDEVRKELNNGVIETK